MKKFKSTWLLALILSSTLFANYHDTGFITWVQPNGVAFIGRGWGDEFEFNYETDTGTG